MRRTPSADMGGAVHALGLAVVMFVLGGLALLLVCSR
jgi:hypothetical protein